MNIPNLLTIARIFFVPLLVAALVGKSVAVRVGGLVVTNEWLALAIFLVAAATDLLDGFLARRWGQITTIGTLLDPIADKLLISAALISLVQVHAAHAWMVVLIIGREFAVTGLRSLAYARGVVVAASPLGKVKMAAEVVAILALILGHDRAGSIYAVGQAALWLVVVAALISAADYFRRFNAILSPRLAEIDAARETPRQNEAQKNLATESLRHRA